MNRLTGTSSPQYRRLHRRTRDPSPRGPPVSKLVGTTRQPGFLTEKSRLPNALAQGKHRAEQLQPLDEALTRLAVNHPQAAQLVQLCFFAGLTQAEAARHLGVSRATAEPTLAFARAWLFRETRQALKAPDESSATAPLSPCARCFPTVITVSETTAITTLLKL